jgi:hypothetical protein
LTRSALRGRFFVDWQTTRRDGTRPSSEPEGLSGSVPLAVTSSPHGGARTTVDLPGAIPADDRRLLIDSEHR